LFSYLLYGIFILSCLVLIVSVLLQPGKSDPGALFTSSVSSTAFGPRGTQTLLAKITIGAAATFFIVALMLGLGVGGQRSLMEGGVAPRPTPAPAASPAAPVQGEATTTVPSPATQPEGGAAATPAAPEASATPAASPAR
jgi:preprotein translocase subunit SecG